jgi:RND family efflux transporter MFP subunit
MSNYARRFDNTAKCRGLAREVTARVSHTYVDKFFVSYQEGLRVTNQLRARTAFSPVFSPVSALPLALIVLAGLCAGACTKGQTIAQAAPAPPEVSVARVLVRNIVEWDEFTGRLVAVDTVAVRPRVSGYIERVAFKEGAEVKRGDPLFLIDQRPYVAELDRARADLQRATSRAELSKRERERAEKMIGTHAISQEEADERINAEHEAGASVSAAQAAVDTATLNLSFTRVTSPIAGRVSRAEITEGNLVSGGTAGTATLLTTVVSLDPIRAYFESDEQVFLKHISLPQAGAHTGGHAARTPVFLGLANEEGYPHEGYLDFVDNQVDPSTGTIRARAVFDNKARLFTPGLFARLKLVGSGRHESVLIDDRAVGTDQDKKFVLQVGTDNATEYRPVVLGPVVDGLRVVRAGLKPGDRIIVNGLQRVRPGMPVTPKEVAMDAASTAAAGQSATNRASH